MPLDKVIFQNPDGTRIEIPKVELAEGCVFLQDELTKDYFYVEASLADAERVKKEMKSRKAKQLSPDQIKKIVYFFRMIDPFLHQPIENWMDDISKDPDPDNEINLWTNISYALNSAIVENPSMTEEEKSELFRVILSLANTGDPQLSVSMIKPTACKPGVVVSVMRHFVKLVTECQDNLPDKEKKSRKSKSGK